MWFWSDKRGFCHSLSLLYTTTKQTWNVYWDDACYQIEALHCIRLIVTCGVNLLCELVHDTRVTHTHTSKYTLILTSDIIHTSFLHNIWYTSLRSIRFIYFIIWMKNWNKKQIFKRFEFFEIFSFQIIWKHGHVRRL